jgi:outer membrane protein assembly factor BamA
MSDLRSFILIFIVLFFSPILYSDIIIEDIIFEGNQLISDSQLAEKITSKIGAIYQPESINRDLEIIENIYTENKFYNFRLLFPEIKILINQRITIIFGIEEFEELIIDSLTVSGQNYISSRNLLKYIFLEKIPLSLLPDKLTKIVQYYNDKGFMFTHVQLDSIRLNDSRYIGYITIDEGKFAHIEEYLFKGNEHCNRKSLLKISQLEKYRVINPDILQQAENRISNKPYIKNCHIYLLDHKKILIDIEEDKMTYFSGILGYNNTGLSSSRFNGFLNVEFLNLFGSDRALGLTWQKLTSNRDLVQLSYHESGPDRTPLNGDFLISREEVDSTYIRSGFSTDLYYYSLYNKYGISLSYSSVFPGSRRPKLISRNDLTSVGLFWEFSNINSINPLKGNHLKIAYYNIFYKTASRNDSRQQTEFLGQSFWNPFGKNVLALSINVKALENKDLQDYQLFTLGGINNLRGYNQDQFKGHLLFWSNFEYRYLLSLRSRIFAFIDYGFVQKYETRIGKLISTGIGLRFNTRLGLLGIDYGFGYENDKFRNPLDGIVHFGLETKL